MKQQVFDCAIIGGGLAGLALAVQLADAGYAVILFEKEKYPFHKVCGEYISMESYDFLERIGMPFSTIDFPLITELRISSPNGKSLTRPLNPGGFGISRYKLDATLAALAKEKGVVLMEETKIDDITFDDDFVYLKSGQTIYPAIAACGAYGKRSALDRKLNREDTREQTNYMAVKYHVKLDLPANRIELHNFRDGYCGVSKVEGGQYCLCYLTNAQNLRTNGNDIRLMEQNVLMKNPHLKKYFAEAEFLYEKPLTISQVIFRKKTPVEGKMLLLGDSAGNIAPLCGNGMSMAMRSSFIAFQLLQQFLEKRISHEKLLGSYKDQWNSQFSRRIKTGRGLQYLFGKEGLTNASIGMLRRVPSLADKLVSLTHGPNF